MNIIQIDPNTIYRYYKYNGSTGFTSLMYLVIHTSDHPEYLDQIKYILDNHPEELDKENDSYWSAFELAVINYKRNSTLDTVELLLKYNP